MFSFLETDVNQLWGPYCPTCINQKFIGHIKEKDELRQLMIFQHDGEKACLKTLPDLRTENSWDTPFPVNESIQGDIRCLSCPKLPVDSCSDTTDTEDFKTSSCLGIAPEPYYDSGFIGSCESKSSIGTKNDGLRDCENSKNSQQTVLAGPSIQSGYCLNSEDECVTKPNAFIYETGVCSGNSTAVSQSRQQSPVEDSLPKSALAYLPQIYEAKYSNDAVPTTPGDAQPSIPKEDMFEEALGIYLQFFKLKILREEVMVSQFKVSNISNNDLASKTPQKYFQPHRHFIGLLSSRECEKSKSDWCVLQAFDCGNFTVFSPQIDQCTLLNTTLFVVPDELFKQYTLDARPLKFRFLSIIAGFRSENTDGRYPSIKSQLLGLRNLMISYSQPHMEMCWVSRRQVLESHEKWKKMVVLACAPQCIYGKVESIFHLCFSKGCTIENGEQLFDVLFIICTHYDNPEILVILDQVLPSFEKSLKILDQSVNSQHSATNLKWIFDLDEDQLTEFKLEPCQRAVGEISLPNRWRSNSLRGKKKDDFELKVLYNEDFNINLLRGEPVICVVPDIETSCRPVAVSHLDHILKVQRARLHHDIPVLNVVLIHVSFERYMEYAEGDRLQSYPIYEDSLTTGLVYHLRYVVEKKDIIWERRRNMSFGMMPCSVALLLSLAPEECFTTMMSIIGKWKYEEYSKRQQLFTLLAEVAWTNDESVFLGILNKLAPSVEQTIEMLSYLV